MITDIIDYLDSPDYRDRADFHQRQVLPNYWDASVHSGSIPEIELMCEFGHSPDPTTIRRHYYQGVRNRASSRALRACDTPRLVIQDLEQLEEVMEILGDFYEDEAALAMEPEAFKRHVMSELSHLEQ